jgi:hypothetical protein
MSARIRRNTSLQVRAMITSGGVRAGSQKCVWLAATLAATLEIIYGTSPGVSVATEQNQRACALMPAGSVVGHAAGVPTGIQVLVQVRAHGLTPFRKRFEVTIGLPTASCARGPVDVTLVAVGHIDLAIPNEPIRAAARASGGSPAFVLYAGEHEAAQQVPHRFERPLGIQRRGVGVVLQTHRQIPRLVRDVRKVCALPAISQQPRREDRHPALQIVALRPIRDPTDPRSVAVLPHQREQRLTALHPNGLEIPASSAPFIASTAAA